MLKQVGSGADNPRHEVSRSPFHPPGQALLDRPIAPARFDAELGIFNFGSSGFVQVAPATDGIDVKASGFYPTSGGFVTVDGSYPGDIVFAGDLSVGGPDTIEVNQFDPTIKYFWLHNWTYLIPFPPPPDLSRLTYSFTVRAQANVRFFGGDGTVMSFVSVGEAPKLLTGSPVVPNTGNGR